MTKLYFAETNGYDMIISVNADDDCRYLTETADFPNLCGMTDQEKKRAALDFLLAVEDDSSWEDDCAYDEIFTDDVEILAEIEIEL